MSALIVNDTGNNAIVDSDGDVRKLQDLVRKLQVQNQMLLGETENQSADAKSENSTCVVDANCNTDIFQCSIPPRTGVLREQQMNSNNTRLMSRTDPEANDDVDSVRAAVSQLSHSLADDSRNTKEQSQNSCLDSVQLIDVDGKLSDDEESWSVILRPRPCQFSSLDPIISIEIILKKLNNLNVTKSPGPDNIHPCILYELRHEIATPLKILFETSYNLGQLPAEWKIGNMGYVAFGT